MSASTNISPRCEQLGEGDHHAGIQQDLAQLTTVGSPLWNFPNYFTGEQVYLGVEAVNMLAQLSAWNVQQLSDTISEWLKY